MRKTFFTVTLTALLVPALAQAQVREVISKEIAVGGAEAALRLEFADEGELRISFEDGTVTVDDEAVGSFQAGGALDAAWRTLLGEAVALDDGPLAERLRSWSPPASLEADALSVARTIDGALEERLSLPAENVEEGEGGDAMSVRIGGGSESALVRALLSQASRLGLLEDALQGLGDDIRIHIDEDVEIADGETVDGTLLVIEANARVAGTVDGDVVVVDGGLELLPGSRVSGEVRLADGRLLRDEGVVEGRVVNVLEGGRESSAPDEDELRERIRRELRNEIRNEVRSATRFDRDEGISLFRPFVTVGRAIGGILEVLLAVFILGLLGAGVAAFAGGNLEAVAETARRSPGRSAMVGMAGSFLLIPVWILGMVALAVSIIGIPVMVAWIPLFPLAAGAAAILGYLAVARNAGEWLAGTNYRYTDWIRKSNPVYTIFGGLLGLATFFVLADLLSVVPLFGFLEGLLTFVGIMISLVAVQIGFGAVLLTRGGRRREYYDDFDAEATWEASAAAEEAMNGEL